MVRANQFLKNRYRIGFDAEIIDAILKNEIMVIIRTPEDKGIPDDAVLIDVKYHEDDGRLWITYDSENFTPKDELSPESYKFSNYHHVIDGGYPQYDVLTGDKAKKVVELYQQIKDVVGDDDGRKV